MAIQFRTKEGIITHTAQDYAALKDVHQKFQILEIFVHAKLQSIKDCVELENFLVALHPYISNVKHIPKQDPDPVRDIVIDIEL
jgi:hypothetical protein